MPCLCLGMHHSMAFESDALTLVAPNVPPLGRVYAGSIPRQLGVLRELQVLDLGSRDGTNQLTGEAILGELFLCEVDVPPREVSERYATPDCGLA